MIVIEIDYSCTDLIEFDNVMCMSKQPITEDTLFVLADVQEAFEKHFGVPTKSLPTLCRYARGVTVPYSNKVVRLKTVFGPGRARRLSLRLWNKFLSDLEAAYDEAMEIQDG